MNPYLDDDVAAAVVGVTVTYGDRAPLVEACIASFIRAGVTQIVVVVNGGCPESLVRLIEARGWDDVEFDWIIFKENVGSAGGFKAGIEAALRRASCDYVWILDDDNTANTNCLDVALGVLRDGLKNAPEVAVSCYRASQGPHAQIAQGIAADDAFPRPGSAQGADIRKKVRGIWPRRASTARRQDLTDGTVEVGMAPWGGLLARAPFLRSLSPPDERFVLYAEDYEYTARMVSNGATILLAMDAVVRDADESVSLDHQLDPTTRTLRTPSEFQSALYYRIRNDMYVDRMRSHGSDRVWLMINLSLLLGKFSWLAVTDKRNRTAWPIVLRALLDGWRGRLGRSRRIHLA